MLKQTTFFIIVAVMLIGISFFSTSVVALESTATGTLKNVAKKLLPARAAVGSAILTAKNANSLTVSASGKTYIVLIDSSTAFRRRFGGKATLSEFSLDDELNIIGKWTDEAQTTIQAKLIRDKSIQKRNGVFFGTVSALTSSGFTIETDRRGLQSVVVGTQTKYLSRKNQTITLTDVKVGDRIRVRGMWDNKLNTISEVEKVKDYSIPVKTTGDSEATSSAIKQ